MSNPQVFDVDQFETELDGLRVTVGVDYDSITITGGAMGIRLTLADSGRFARAFTEAAWRAGYHQSLGHDG